MLSNVGKKLKNTLIEQNISQKKLSELTNIKQQIISDWINGRRNPKVSSLKKIADVLNKSIEYFIDDNNNIKYTNNNTLKDKEFELLKKENELLKKETEMLKANIIELKREIKKLKK